MKYRCFLLDWDGCLADTLSLWVNTYLAVYKKWGHVVTVEDIIRLSWGNNEQGPKNVGIKDYLQCWEEIAATVRKDIESVQLHEHARELLIKLRQSDCKVAIVTSSERRLLEPALRKHELEQYIDVVITEGEVTEPKPNPEMLLLAMKKLEANPMHTIIIGDSHKDILAGKNAGIATGLVLHEDNRPFYDFDKLKKTDPDYVFRNLRDVEKVLFSNS